MDSAANGAVNFLDHHLSFGNRKWLCALLLRMKGYLTGIGYSAKMCPIAPFPKKRVEEELNTLCIYLKATINFHVSRQEG